MDNAKREIREKKPKAHRPLNPWESTAVFETFRAIDKGTDTTEKLMNFFSIKNRQSITDRITPLFEKKLISREPLSKTKTEEKDTRIQRYFITEENRIAWLLTCIGFSMKPNTGNEKWFLGLNDSEILEEVLPIVDWNLLLVIDGTIEKPYIKTFNQAFQYFQTEFDKETKEIRESFIAWKKQHQKTMALYKKLKVPRP